MDNTQGGIMPESRASALSRSEPVAQQKVPQNDGKRDRRTLPTLCLIALWGTGIVGAFWYLEWQYLRPVGRPAGAADLTPATLPLSPLATIEVEEGEVQALRSDGLLPPVTLLNFWNPSCPCSRYMEGHVQSLSARFAAQGIRLITLVECGASAEERNAARKAWRARSGGAGRMSLDPGGTVARTFGVWAAPAAVVLNQRGQVIYVGAYNAARYCDNRETAWAEQAIEATLAHRLPRCSKAPFFGCQVRGSSQTRRSSASG